MFGMGAPSLPSALAAGGDTAQTVTQTEQAESVNLLSKLEIQGIPFDQGEFSPGTSNYTATVENSVKSITLLASSDSTNAKITITVNGQTVNDNTQPITLNTGDNQIEIMVVDGVNQAKYNLTLTRMKSSNDLLKDLQLSSGENSLLTGFNTNTFKYNVQVANDVTNVTVTPSAADSTASVTAFVNGTSVTNDTVQLPTDTTVPTEITILVTAENGDQKTYTIDVTKAAPSTSSSSSSTGGTSSSSSGTSSSSSGTSSSSSGTSSSSSGKSSSSSGKSSSSSGKSASSSGKSAAYSGKSSSKSASGLTGLKYTSQGSGAGSSTSFKSASGSGTGSYSQTQGTAAVQPSKATLSDLTVTAGTWNNTFAKDTYTYHIAVGSDVDTVAINGTATYSGSTISVNGSADNTVSLGDQQKTIVPIVVTNGTDKKTYILVFDKAVPQSVATTADNQTASSTDSQVTDTSIQSSNSMPTTNNRNGRNNNGGNNNGTTNTSFWSSLIESIRSFFSKL
jgi:hypothetical protein